MMPEWFDVAFRSEAPRILRGGFASADADACPTRSRARPRAPDLERAFASSGWPGQSVPPPLVVNSGGFSQHAANSDPEGPAGAAREALPQCDAASDLPRTSGGSQRRAHRMAAAQSLARRKHCVTDDALRVPGSPRRDRAASLGTPVDVPGSPGTRREGGPALLYVIRWCRGRSWPRPQALPKMMRPRSPLSVQGGGSTSPGLSF